MSKEEDGTAAIMMREHCCMQEALKTNVVCDSVGEILGRRT